MASIRRLLLAFMALFLLGFYFGPGVTAAFLQPGSENDPLVTKKWVDTYVLQELSKTEQQISLVDQKIRQLDQSVQEASGGLSQVMIVTVNKKTALLGDQEVAMDVPPALLAGRVYLPLRFIGEALGASFSWEPQTKTVIFDTGKNKVELVVGAKKALVNGTEVALDSPPYISGSRVMVPLRFVGEAFGAKVTWHGETKSVEIK